MRTRSQTKNEALKTKSSLDKSSNDKPLKKTSLEKPYTRSSSSSSTNDVQTNVDTSVHLINSTIFVSTTSDRVIQKPLKPILYEPIDFDDASACWRMNKQSLGNGQYKYVCAFMKIDNTRCGRNVKKGCMACRYHL